VIKKSFEREDVRPVAGSACGRAGLPMLLVRTYAERNKDDETIKS
jgi:hypothetical protein